jgi:branched-chain amino acid transport system permease protein
MVQVLGTGLAMGCIYALVGLSFILIYNATYGLNFAQGELVMLAAFVFASVLATGIPYWVAAGATAVAMAAFGFVYQRILFYPLRNRSFLAFIVVTIAFSLLARNLGLMIWGPNALRVPSYFGDATVSVLNVVLAPEHLFIVAATMCLLGVQYLLFFHTDLGRRLRATAQNQEMAQLLGIRPSRMIAVTFILATVLAGVAGVLVAPIFFIDTEMGQGLMLKAFMGVIIGGFGSIPGTVIGGVMVGLLEILVAVFLSSTYKDAITFAILIAFLFAFPQGVFGERIAERA